MNSTATGNSVPSEKGRQRMETNADGTYFQEGDQVRIKRTGKIGRINAADGGVVYVIMDQTNETTLFQPMWTKMPLSNLSLQRRPPTIALLLLSTALLKRSE